MTLTRTKRLRGYLLFESVLAAAFTATTLVITLSLISNARTQSIGAARQSAAATLVQSMLDEKRSLGFGGLAAGTVTEDAVAGMAGSWARTTVVTGPVTETIGAVTAEYMRVNVTVDVTGQRPVSAEGRIYR